MAYSEALAARIRSLRANRAGLAAAAALATTLGVAAGRASEAESVTAAVTVTTADHRRNVAVLSRDEPAFLFCIDLATPLAEKITYAGTARVVYRPLPRIEPPPGVKVDRQEFVEPVLAVLPSGARGWLFLAKGEKSVLSAKETAAGVTTVPARGVNRLDWVPADGGLRRGMDVESCLEAAGS